MNKKKINKQKRPPKAADMNNNLSDESSLGRSSEMNQKKKEKKDKAEVSNLSASNDQLDRVSERSFDSNSPHSWASRDSLNDLN